MASLKTECRKFSPNIFNKSKCQNCFRGKDAHSSEALESNRATRKVSCCGYLFVAPDWDFTLPANRNKRWQRRWFVLYDDGELAYSVDEHPETIPQAVIDMNCVLEVSDAESVTGNPFAIAVTCPEKVHFIKGMSKEESKKWFEVLSKFPRNTVCGKYKRNATFPCIKATTVPKIENTSSTINNRRETVELSNYSKHNGYVNSLNRNNRNHSSSIPFDPDDDVVPTKDTNSSMPKMSQSDTKSSEDKKEETPIILNESNLRSCQENASSKTEEVKKYLKHEGRSTRKLHSRSDVSKMIPKSLEEKIACKTDWKKMALDLDSVDCIGKSYHNPVYLMMSDVPSGKKLDSYENFFSQDRPTCLRRQSSFGKKSDLQRQLLWSDDCEAELKDRTLHKSASVPNAVLKDDNKILINGSCKMGDKYSTDSIERAKSTINQVRGDPDGCNLDSLPYCSSSAEFLGGQNSENVFLKKGWLVKQDECKWNKYWFVLRNSALTFYSDPIAEDAGILDGVVDLRKVKSVSEVQSSSGFTFCVVMKDFSKLYLSAVTSKIRNNWIRAILQSANLKSVELDDDTPNKRSDLDLKTLELSKEKTASMIQLDTSISSLESEKSSSSSGSKTVVEEEESERIQEHKSVPLPPSPPLARTAISRVKERARTRSNSRTRSSRFRSTEIHESDHNYLADSDDGATDHSSSSQPNSGIIAVKEKKLIKESSPKHSEEKCRPERRRSFKLSSLDSVTLKEGRKKVTDIKDKLEDYSWTIWLDISKFCKEVESKLDDLEEKSPKNGPHLSGEQKKDIGSLISSLSRVEDRLQKVQIDLEKAKTTLLLNNKDNDLDLNLNTSIGCHSLKQEVSRLSGISSQNVLLAQQLYKVREENRRLKSEVKNAQASSDDFELKCISLKQVGEQEDKLHKSQMELMVARVDDLTSKLLASEKNVRQLRQRVMKLEQRQERRRSSLKGKEALSLSKEYETKLSELEQKIDAVEGVLKHAEQCANETENDKEDSAKETQSLLMRLHNLDKKVKDVTETVTAPAEELIKQQENIQKPKICLQVNLNDSMPLQDVSEDWNSLSLSTSMTDLTNPEKDEICNMESMSLSFYDCLETLGHKMTSLISWLKTSLQLLYAQGHMNPFHASKIDFISSEASEELGRLVRVLDHVMSKNEEPSTISPDVSYIVGRLLYNIILLQEMTNVIFKMSDFEKYKTAILVQHLNRVKQAIFGIEQYIQQKSNPVHASVQKLSLCNIVACLLFHRSSIEEVSEVSNIKSMFEEVDSQRQKVCNILSEFKEKFIERFCTTILELSEDSVCDKNIPKSNDQKSDTRPLGQKQFLSHISHIISQVSQSFISHVSKSLNEVYFLCSSFQYSQKWTDYICKLLQQELSLLSSEIKSICVKHLENNFFSSSKCGVLVEYMHCSISELAQIVSIITIVDGTVILIKDAIYGDSDTVKGFIQSGSSSVGDKEAFNTFHENLQVRTMSIMSNLPLYRFPNSFFSLCNPNELNVAHRSVSSLLCFKHKWKCAAENERKEYSSQIDKLKAKISELLTEQKKREEAGCKSCIELRQEVSYLQAELDESRVVARTGSLCEKCKNLKLEIQHLMEQHEKDLEHLEKLEEQELLWKERMQGVIDEKEQQYMDEKQKLEKELLSAQRNLKLIENQCDEEIRKLQAAYENKLQQKHENVQENLIRQRYSEEIEELKLLCERGLAAMDASHQKIVSELESRHHRELEELMSEREKALAEEAHATAVALEAVRKAHSEELQRQVQKFKDEFVLKMNKRFETEAFKKCYESDLSSIKNEILSMTEKYSVKCLENATLQEKLEVMTQQLKCTTTQVVELLAKNQQLQAHLASNSMKKQEELL